MFYRRNTLQKIIPLMLILTGIFCNNDLVLSDLQSCEIDSDCVQVPTGCCGCSSGGEDSAIHRQYREEWLAYLKGKCAQIACLAVYLCDDYGEPVCNRSKCKLPRLK